MRWKTNKEPIRGEIRTFKKFAYFPVNIHGTVVWWEYFYITAKWHTPNWAGGGYWETIDLYLYESEILAGTNV
jgi:hypothetical protein